MDAVIDITVSPKSSKSEITLMAGDSIKVYLHSPPVEGKANEECIALFSKRLGIPKYRIEIDKGARGKKKRLMIHGMSDDAVMKILRG